MTLAKLATSAVMTPAPADLLVPGPDLIDVPAMRAAIGLELVTSSDAKTFRPVLGRYFPLAQTLVSIHN